VPTVGEVLIKLLEQYEVEDVFGIPGVHTIELYRGLADSSIRHHTPRHEQGAGFMADGYARVSGKPGVCFVITGPGLTNIATAMAQALADSIPMLVISSVNDTIATPQARGMLHEMPDQLAFSSQVARLSETICTADELPIALAKAFGVFASARPGPVHFQLPVSLLGSQADQNISYKIPALPMRSAAPDADIKAAAALINSAQKVCVLAGGGAVGAAEEVRLLAEKINAPVHLTINSRGLLPVEHELGVAASCTLHTVRDVLNEADVVLALGTELAQTDYDQYKDDSFTIAGKLIRCDIDALQINNNFAADVSLIGDAAQTVRLLLEQVAPQPNGDGKERAAKAMQSAYSELGVIEKRHLDILEAIRDTLPTCLFVGDSTQLVYSGNMYFNTSQPRQWFNSSVGFGTLGYALPAATGAALAAGGKPVVCLIGDGGLQFVLGELGALRDANVQVAVVVWCNGGYAEIKNSMERAEVTSVGVEFTVPDYLSVADAYGIKSLKVTGMQELCLAIEDSAVQQISVLIVADEEQMMLESG